MRNKDKEKERMNHRNEKAVKRCGWRKNNGTVRRRWNEERKISILRDNKMRVDGKRRN